MLYPDVMPTGIERTFDPDQFIVTKTDLKGRITYANPLFLDIVGLPWDKVKGQPHNLIRHPDMPRGVFHLLWEMLAEEQEVFAYVNNLAADGCHYWVYAHITPSYDEHHNVIGYHSSRRVPDKRIIPTIESVYQLMLDAEQGKNTHDAVLASRKVLDDICTDKGMPYPELIWRLLEGVQ